jgi:energy-converting hydrogenase Eha subunit E
MPYNPPLTSIATVAVALILAGLTLLAGLASLTVLALASLACLAFLTGLAIDAVPTVIYLRAISG